MPKNPIARTLIALTLLLPMQVVFADAANNAALRYWRGLSMMSPELEETIRQVRKGGLLAEAAWAPNEGPIGSLDQSQIDGIVREFLKGAALPECDFGPDWDEGIEMLIPHLGGMRTGVVLLLIDGRSKLAQGDSAAAADRFAAAYAIAAHSANDRILVSSLVSAHMVSLANETVLQPGVLEQLRPADRKTIALATWKFGADDPFLLRAAIANEGAMMDRWLREQFADPMSESELKALLGTLFDPTDDFEPLMAVINDPDEFEASLVRLRLFYTEVDAAWEAEDADERLERIESEFSKETDENRFGILAEFFAPAIARTRINERKAVESLERARSLLGA